MRGWRGRVQRHGRGGEERGPHTHPAVLKFSASLMFSLPPASISRRAQSDAENVYFAATAHTSPAHHDSELAQGRRIGLLLTLVPLGTYDPRSVIISGESVAVALIKRFRTGLGRRTAFGANVPGQPEPIGCRLAGSNMVVRSTCRTRAFRHQQSSSTHDERNLWREQ